MPVLVTSNFDNDLIKTERASTETPFSHYKSMGNFFRCLRAANSVVRLSVAMETRVLTTRKI